MTLQELKDKISIITKETQPGANTAQRIGSTMQDIASFVSAYPVVTIKDNFTIDAQPNTFYNIKNNGEDSVNINIDTDKYSVDEQEKLTMFVWDTMGEDIMNSGLGNMNTILLVIIFLGHHIKEDSTYEDYKYSSFQSLEGQGTEEDSGKIITTNFLYQIKSYFSDEVKTGNNINWCIKQILLKGKSVDENGNVVEDVEMDLIGELGQDIIIPITNIQVPTENNDDLALITLKEEYQELPFSDLPHVFIEVENDNEEYSHKYEVFGFIPLQMNIPHVYTNEPLPNTTDIYGDGMNLSEYADIKFVKNIDQKGCEVANEYVFNINSPANVTFNQSIKWNNGNEPDLSQNGTYTISLLNGVGCFTFVE